MENTTQKQLKSESHLMEMPYLMIRKVQSQDKLINSSVFYINKGNNNRISFKLKNDNKFFEMDHIDNNIRKIYKTLSENKLNLLSENGMLLDNLIEVSRADNVIEENKDKTRNEDISHTHLLHVKPYNINNTLTVNSINNNIFNNLLSLNNNLNLDEQCIKEKNTIDLERPQSFKEIPSLYFIYFRSYKR